MLGVIAPRARLAVGLCVGFVALLAICWPFVKDRAPLVTTISATTPPAEVELRPSRGGLTLDGVVRSDVEAEGTNGVVVELPSASFVSGRVLDEDGWPVAGVTLRLHRQTRLPWWRPRALTGHTAWGRSRAVKRSWFKLDRPSLGQQRDTKWWRHVLTLALSFADASFGDW